MAANRMISRDILYNIFRGNASKRKRPPRGRRGHGRKAEGAPEKRKGKTAVKKRPAPRKNGREKNAVE